MKYACSLSYFFLSPFLWSRLTTAILRCQEKYLYIVSDYKYSFVGD